MIESALQIIALALFAAFAVVMVARWRWSRASARIDAELTAAPLPSRPLRDSALPPVVRDFLDCAISDGERRVEIARIRQRGRFRVSEAPERWRPFTATEVFRVVEPAFYWDARIRLAGPLTIRVRDVYSSGSGGMLGKVAGIVPVVKQENDPQLAKGALMRYLAEAVWFPTRLATGPGLEWSAADATSAEATLEDRGVIATVRFTFNEHHDAVEVSGVRPREVGGAFIDTPWIGRFADHRPMGAFRIPLYGVVAWVIDGVEVPYWEGAITGAAYRFC